jgi:circadian clock protein KaiC
LLWEKHCSPHALFGTIPRCLRPNQFCGKYLSTVLLLDDKMNRVGVRADLHVLSLRHGVIEMEWLSPGYGTARRRLRVFKLRGIRFREGWHDYSILTGGLQVFPRLIAAVPSTSMGRTATC